MPNLEVAVPWNKTRVPSLHRSNATRFTDDMLFTKEYIRSAHCSIIEWMTRAYVTLTTMAYLDNSEIKLPPHPNLSMEELADIGVDAEARALLRYLPYLDNEREISPFTKSYSYLSDVVNARRVLWDGENDLAPWVIRLSECPPAAASHGRTIIYDLRTKRIAEWPNNEGGYTNTYLDLPTSTPEEYFGRWVEFLKDLKEIPWRNKKVYEMSSEPPAPPSGFLDYLINGYVDPAEGPPPRNP
tara:strand:+ start:721 stop:1446 length:726 start_codon:yes stop_codon:yes gene_type:complete